MAWRLRSIRWRMDRVRGTEVAWRSHGERTRRGLRCISHGLTWLNMVESGPKLEIFILSLSFYIYIYNHMNSRHNYLSISMPCENYGRPPSVVRISAFSDFEATHAKQGYQLSVYGCPPIRSEGFAHPSARPRRSTTKLVLITIILSVTHIIYYRMMYILYRIMMISIHWEGTPYFSVNSDGWHGMVELVEQTPLI